MCPVDRHICERAPLFPALFFSQANKDDKAGKGSRLGAEWPHSILLISLTVRFVRIPLWLYQRSAPPIEGDRHELATRSLSSQQHLTPATAQAVPGTLSRALGRRAAAIIWTGMLEAQANRKSLRRPHS